MTTEYGTLLRDDVGRHSDRAGEHEKDRTRAHCLCQRSCRGFYSKWRSTRFDRGSRPMVFP